MDQENIYSAEEYLYISIGVVLCFIILMAVVVVTSTYFNQTELKSMARRLVSREARRTSSQTASAIDINELFSRRQRTKKQVAEQEAENSNSSASESEAIGNATPTASPSSATYVNLSYALDVPLSPVTAASKDRNDPDSEQFSSGEKSQDFKPFVKQIYPKLETQTPSGNDEKIALEEREIAEEIALKRFVSLEPVDLNGNIETSLLTHIELAVAKQKECKGPDADKNEDAKDLNLHLQPFASKLNGVSTSQQLSSGDHGRSVGPEVHDDENNFSPTEQQRNVVKEKEVESIVSVKEIQNCHNIIAQDQKYNINVMQSYKEIEHNYSDSSRLDEVNNPTVACHDSEAQRKPSTFGQIQQVDDKPSESMHEIREPAKTSSVPEPPPLKTDELLNKVAALTQQLSEKSSLNQTPFVAEDSGEQMSDKHTGASPTKLRSTTQLNEQPLPQQANNEQQIDEESLNNPPFQTQTDQKTSDKKWTIQTASKIAEQMFGNIANEVPVFLSSSEVKKTSVEE